MAKVVLTMWDDGSRLRLSAEFDPPLPNLTVDPDELTHAQMLGFHWMMEFKEKMNVEFDSITDTKNRKHPFPKP